MQPRIYLYVSDETKEKIKIAAKKKQLSVNAWVRLVVLRELEKEGK